MRTISLGTMTPWISFLNAITGLINGESTKCQTFQGEDLQYVGNLVTDIQLLSFELINKHDLSWNYCPGGAADMAALTGFAIHGHQFVENTPELVGSHDPMIHPGKGVMGLRFNGVDGVDMRDVKIQNIHSTTGLGTLLGGVYEQVVSQQAPYMNGFSMNMVNGMSATFTSNIAMNNVHVDRVISSTGLAYGVAAWYETDIDISGNKGLIISNIHAGKELAPSNEYTKDSYPNLRPEACAFRIYDDVIYKAEVSVNENAKGTDNVQIECVTGHTGCRMEQDKWSHVGTVSACSEGGSSASPSLYDHNRASNNDKNDQWMERDDASAVWTGGNKHRSKTSPGNFGSKKGATNRNVNEERSAVVVKDGAHQIWKGVDHGVLQKIAPGNAGGVLLMLGGVVLLSVLAVCNICVSTRALTGKRQSGMTGEIRPLLDA